MTRSVGSKALRSKRLSRLMWTSSFLESGDCLQHYQSHPWINTSPPPLSHRVLWRLSDLSPNASHSPGPARTSRTNAAQSFIPASGTAPQTQTISSAWKERCRRDAENTARSRWKLSNPSSPRINTPSLMQRKYGSPAAIPWPSIEPSH